MKEVAGASVIGVVADAMHHHFHLELDRDVLIVVIAVHSPTAVRLEVSPPSNDQLRVASGTEPEDILEHYRRML